MALALDCLTCVKQSQLKPQKPVRDINILLAAVSTFVGAFLVKIPRLFLFLLCVAAFAMIIKEEQSYRERKKAYKKLLIKHQLPLAHSYFVQDQPFELKLTTQLQASPSTIVEHLLTLRQTWSTERYECKINLSHDLGRYVISEELYHHSKRVSTRYYSFGKLQHRQGLWLTYTGLVNNE